MRGRFAHHPIRPPGVRCSSWRFHCLVRGACDRLPLRFQRLLLNVAVTVEEVPPSASFKGGDALGLYEGTPLGQRGTGYTLTLPDKITIYRQPLLATCHRQRELREEIELTVLHEIGHHFGMEDHEIPF